MSTFFQSYSFILSPGGTNTITFPTLLGVTAMQINNAMFVSYSDSIPYKVNIGTIMGSTNYFIAYDNQHVITNNYSLAGLSLTLSGSATVTIADIVGDVPTSGILSFSINYTYTGL